MMMHRQVFIIFVSILTVTNCQICCFNCYCPYPGGTGSGVGDGSLFIYLIYPSYGSFPGSGGLGASYGPAVNGLCPVGVNIGGQCYAVGG
uniref:Uncharacterized protein n=1 Tax=Wuchereria bancrofti TaxID=6293 RepID=A0AAF5Q2C8_WUCBA